MMRTATTNHGDLHYRNVMLTCDLGCIAEAYDTDAYGRTHAFYDAAGVHEKADPLCVYLFTGRRYEPETTVLRDPNNPNAPVASGLYYYRARHYHMDVRAISGSLVNV